MALSSELRDSIIAPGWIVGPVFSDKSDLLASNLTIVCIVRELQKDFFSDREVLPLLSGKILLDEFTIGTAKVIEGIGDILADVDLPVWIGDFVNNLHP